MVNSSTSSSRRGFFLKLGAFLLLIALLDLGVGSLLRHFYFTQNAGLNRRTTYAVQESRDPILVLGSSRAQAHYVPAMLGGRLDGSCYNAGRNGQSILYAGAVFQAVLARQAPEVVVLDVVPTDFYHHHGHYDRLSALLPYYRDNEAVRPFVRLRSPLEPIKLASRIYPFNSLPLQILKYNLTTPTEDRGFVAQQGTIREPLRPPKDRHWVRNGLDDNALGTFRDLVATCRERDIDLYVVISPLFDGKVFGEEAIGVLEEILEGTPYALWDYSDHGQFLRKGDLFRDRDHLNRRGAEAYSALLVERILKERGEGRPGGNLRVSLGPAGR